VGIDVLRGGKPVPKKRANPEKHDGGMKIDSDLFERTVGTTPEEGQRLKKPVQTRRGNWSLAITFARSRHAGAR